MPETVDIPQRVAWGMEDVFEPPTLREVAWTVVLLVAGVALWQALSGQLLA